MRFLLVVMAMLLATQTPVMAGPVVKLAAGVNGIWYDNAAEPGDFEAGVNARASLSPHISLVGAGYYGFQHQYLRGSGGVRVTATDVDNPNFSVGLGIQYHWSSEPEIRPEEWAPDASVGWRPWPESAKNWIVVGQASYGLTTAKMAALAGLRYAF